MATAEPRQVAGGGRRPIARRHPRFWTVATSGTSSASRPNEKVDAYATGCTPPSSNCRPPSNRVTGLGEALDPNYRHETRLPGRLHVPTRP